MEHTIQFKINDKGRGSYFINNDKGEQIAELDFHVKDNLLTAYHTGVRKELEGQGIASKLFDKVVEYARENNYKIIPTCSYVAVKLRRNSDKYADVWTQTGDEPTGKSCGIPPR